MIPKSLLPAGLLVAAVAAQAQVPAQPGVQLYGLIDNAVEHLNNVGASGGSLTRLPGITASLPSRWGLRGTEDLGSGQRAVFVLESGFAPDTGASNQGNRLFGRQAYVGLAGSWGTLMLGRQYDMFYLSLLDAGILGPNVYALGSLDPYIPAARFDNALGYIGRFGGFTAGAVYSLGRDTVAAGGSNCAGESATDDQACRAAAAMLKYDAGTWGVSGSFSRQRGGAAATTNSGGNPALSLLGSARDDTRKSLVGYVKFGPVKLSGGVIRRDNDALGALAATAGALTRRSDLGFVEAAYAITPTWSVDGAVAQLDYKNSSAESTLVALRTTYSLSRRTAVYLTAGHINNDGAVTLSVSGGQPGGNTAPGATQTGIALGMRHAF